MLDLSYHLLVISDCVSLLEKESEKEKKNKHNLFSARIQSQGPLKFYKQKYMNIYIYYAILFIKFS